MGLFTIQVSGPPGSGTYQPLSMGRAAPNRLPRMKLGPSSPSLSPANSTPAGRTRPLPPASPLLWCHPGDPRRQHTEHPEEQGGSQGLGLHLSPPSGDPVERPCSHTGLTSLTQAVALLPPSRCQEPWQALRREKAMGQAASPQVPGGFRPLHTASGPGSGRKAQTSQTPLNQSRTPLWGS